MKRNVHITCNLLQIRTILKVLAIIMVHYRMYANMHKMFTFTLEQNSVK